MNLKSTPLLKSSLPPPQSDDFIGPTPGVYILTIALKYSPEEPRDEDRTMTELGPGACYGGFNRVTGKGSVEVVLRTGKKCIVNQGSFPPNYPHPIPPGEGGNLDQECYDAFLVENATDPVVDGSNCHLRANLISSVKIDFSKETECFSELASAKFLEARTTIFIGEYLGAFAVGKPLFSVIKNDIAIRFQDITVISWMHHLAIRFTGIQNTKRSVDYEHVRENRQEC